MTTGETLYFEGAEGLLRFPEYWVGSYRQRSDIRIVLGEGFHRGIFARQGGVLQGSGAGNANGAGESSSAAPCRGIRGGPVQAVKLLPQPQPPVAFGFSKVNPDPCIDET